MALQIALTNDQLTDIRSGAYQALQFVCLVPNAVVVQFQPDTAPSLSVFAEIEVGTVTSGDMADIAEGQLVIFSTTSDYKASEIFRTRVRKVSGTTSLYVGENSTTLTTGSYVTVINTYEIQERLRRSETLVDWDIPYRELRPVEAALPSAVVLSNDETTYTLTAAPVAMDATATSSFTHLWASSNASDVITDEDTDSPSFDLQAAAFRWLRYTFTDSNGNSNYRVIPCWTVPKDYSSVIALGFMGSGGEVASINFDAELGWTATVPAWDGVSTLLNKTYCVIASDEWYDSERQNIRTNIDFVGYMQTEAVNTSADERFGRVSEMRYSVEGFGHQLSRQNISPVTIIRTATPIAWDDIKDPTPGRMLTYRLTEYSTASTLMAIRLPADDGDYIGDDLTLSTEKALDDLQAIAVVLNAEIQFDVDGALEMCRDINYLGSSARNAAPVVATLTHADFAGQYSIEYEYGRTTAQATIVGGAYNTTRDTYDLYEAITPAEARYSEGDPLELSNQVLATDATAADSMAEIKERAANFLAANNPTWVLRCSLKDQWHFLVPDVGAWFKFTIAASDTVRGRVFGSSDRWQLIQIDVSSNALTGTRDVNAVFRHETQSTGASVRVAPIVNDLDADMDYAPAVFPPLAGGDLGFTGGYYYDAIDPNPPSEPNPVPANCEIGGFRPKSGVGTETTGSALNGETISYRVRGSGKIGEGTPSNYTYDFTAAAQGFSLYSASWNNGFRDSGGWRTGSTPLSDGVTNGYRVRITRTFSSPFVDIQTVSVTLGGGFADAYAYFYDGETLLYTWTITGGGSGSSVNTFTDSGNVLVNVDRIDIRRAVTTANYTSPAYIVDLTVTGTGSGDLTYGDAFYYTEDEWTTATPYDAGDGLLIEGFQPASIPPFSPSHEYEGIFTSTSGPIQYDFNSPYSTSEMSNWSIQVITCFNGVP